MANGEKKKTRKSKEDYNKMKYFSNNKNLKVKVRKKYNM